MVIRKTEHPDFPAAPFFTFLTIEKTLYPKHHEHNPILYGQSKRSLFHESTLEYPQIQRHGPLVISAPPETDLILGHLSQFPCLTAKTAVLH